MTAKRGMPSVPALPTVAWRYERLGEKKAERSNPTKESLLRRSLDLVQGQKANEEAVREIVEKSLDAGLIRLAKEALRAFSSDAGFHMYVSIQSLFSEPGYWNQLEADFVAYCESRVLAGKMERSGMYIGDHAPDQRSEALGELGKYQFFTGNPRRAFELWAAAGDARDVDEVIARMCEMIAENEPSHLDAAISLSDLIRTRNIRAKVLATLSSYV